MANTGLLLCGYVESSCRRNQTIIYFHLQACQAITLALQQMRRDKLHIAYVFPVGFSWEDTGSDRINEQKDENVTNGEWRIKEWRIKDMRDRSLYSHRLSSVVIVSRQNM